MDKRSFALGMLAVSLVAALAGCTTPNAETQDESVGRSPYVEQLASSIRGLSAQEIEELRTGAGMGFARPAELNGWPGPLHALELADELALSADQRAALQTLREDMLDEAVPLGERILAVYARTEKGFRDGAMDDATLKHDLAELESLYARLRYVHLATHLEAAAIFTPEQRHEYMRLRGYTDHEGGDAGHGHGGH